MRLALTLALGLASVLGPFLFRWLRRRLWGLPVRVVVDPDDPTPADIGGYLAEIARRLDARPERMRIAFIGHTERNRALSLDLEADGALRVEVDGHRAHRVDLRRRWIAEHPVPLSLRRVVLYVDPVDANRFRVMTSPPFNMPMLVYVGCSLLATLGIVFWMQELLAIAVGLALGGIFASCDFFVKSH